MIKKPLFWVSNPLFNFSMFTLMIVNVISDFILLPVRIPCVHSYDSLGDFWFHVVACSLNKYKRELWKMHIV